eukprot:scaffold147803_cov18-Prasinocladus_malaysianus.AAC.1
MALPIALYIEAYEEVFVNLRVRNSFIGHAITRTTFAACHPPRSSRPWVLADASPRRHTYGCIWEVKFRRELDPRRRIRMQDAKHPMFCQFDA